jgi:hypothetical protein
MAAHCTHTCLYAICVSVFLFDLSEVSGHGDCLSSQEARHENNSFLMKQHRNDPIILLQEKASFYDTRRDAKK